MATRSIGKVTTAAAGGGAVGAALAGILVWLLTQWGLDAGSIEAAISVVLTAAFGLFGGYLVPAPTEPAEDDADGYPVGPEHGPTESPERYEH